VILLTLVSAERNKNIGMRIWALSLTAKLNRHNAALRDILYLKAYCSIFYKSFIVLSLTLTRLYSARSQL
jgi:hypothetical protein